jgi:glycosyltransferase involved in cell wall biosynthesis
MRRFREQLDRGWSRRVARAAVNSIIALELGAVRLIGVTRKPPARLPPDALTIIIKTFERPRELRRLVRSIHRLQPGVRIVVADDSRQPCVIDGVDMVRLRFNSGVSAGRNAALAQVRTEYFMSLDDDFVLTKHSDIAAPLLKMMAAPSLDIVGGVIVNLPEFSTIDYTTAGLFSTPQQPLREPGTLVEGLPIRLKVPNFFVGRTETVRRVGWTDDLPFIEHLDFFSRACGQLLVAQDERMIGLHAKNVFDRNQHERRVNTEVALTVLNDRYAPGRSER